MQFPSLMISAKINNWMKAKSIKYFLQNIVSHCPSQMTMPWTSLALPSEPFSIMMLLLSLNITAIVRTRQTNLWWCSREYEPMLKGFLCTSSLTFYSLQQGSFKSFLLSKLGHRIKTHSMETQCITV